MIKSTQPIYKKCCKATLRLAILDAAQKTVRSHFSAEAFANAVAQINDKLLAPSIDEILHAELR